MEKKLPVYDLIIENEDVEGLTAMGFVEFPAIQQDFIYFNKNKHNNKYVMSLADGERRMVVGPALIPNKKIIRQDFFGDLYYVKFSPELVETLAHNYLIENKLHLTTEQHETPIKGIYMIESWIVKNEQDKIYTVYGYDIKNVALGSWCVQYKIDNDDVLNKIKNGEIKGFSIEAYLSEKMSMSNEIDELMKHIEKYENKTEIYNILKKMDL